MDERLRFQQVLISGDQGLKKCCEFKVGPAGPEQRQEAVDRELKAVADIQRSLLPAVLPRIPTMGLAVHYQTARWSGGDY